MKNRIIRYPIELLFITVLFSFMFSGCTNKEKLQYDRSVEVYNSWVKFHNEKNYENCLTFKNKIRDFNTEDFLFYPESYKKIEASRNVVLSDCDTLLEILENNSDVLYQDNVNVNKKITNIIDEIDIMMLSYLRNQNYILGESQYRYTTFYSLLIIAIVVGAIILIFLNETELKKKNVRISQSETVLRHTIEVQENERSRISRELHDTVAQSMRYVSLLAEKITDKELSETIIREQNTNIEDIRKLCYNLTPPDFKNIGMVDSINILGQKIFDGTETQIRIVTNGDIDFSVYSQEQQMNIYRIIQELFQNSRKYAEATEVTVLFRSENKLKIIVSDDGKGMEEEMVKEINNKTISLSKNLHFGIKNIMERVQLLNGTIDYRSVEDFGTTVIIEI